MTTPGATRTVLLLVGMRDHRCRERIAHALGSVAGVREVDVNLYRALATVVHGPPCGAAALLRAVRGTGYGAALVGDAAGEGEEGDGGGDAGRGAGGDVRGS